MNFLLNKKLNSKLYCFQVPKLKINIYIYVVKLLVHEILWIGIQLILYVLSRMQFKEF